MTETSTKAWERLEGETNAAWRAFCYYRDDGLARTFGKAYAKYLEAAGRIHGGDRSPRWFRDWTSKYRWTERTRAYDEDELERTRIENEQLRAEARGILVKHAPAAARSMAVMAQGRKLPDQTVPSNVARQAQRDLLKFAGVDAPKRVEVSGPDGGPVEFEGGAFDLSKLSDEELDVMYAITRKATGADEEADEAEE